MTDADTPQRPGRGERVVVVGGGGAAGMLARTLRRGGWGGEVVVLTSEPYGPYDRTMLSKSALLGVVDEPKPLLGPPDEPGATSIEVRRSTTVVAIDPDRRTVSTDGGEEVAWDHLVIATGGRPRTLDLPGADLDFVHTLRERAEWPGLRDAARSGGHLVVVGGGLIGLEVAAAAVAHDTTVTVVEVADRLIGRLLPPVLADAVADTHAAHGVEILLDTRPVAFVDAADDHPRGVALDDGRVLPADAVLVSVGAVPRVDLASATGLVVDDGIVVDAGLRTGLPGVHAIGDAVRVTAPDGTLLPRTQSWTPAQAMGQHVARHLLGDDAPFTQPPWMWSDQYDLRLQAIGAGVPGLEQVHRGDLADDTGLVVFGLADDRVRGAVGLGRGRGPGRTIRAAQALIERDVVVDPADLADPDVDLRALARR